MFETESIQTWCGARFPAALFACVLLAACGSDDSDKPVTYWQDVAPIVFENCVGCHRDGGIAPFALDTYEKASFAASSMAHATAQRIMPPWLVTDDGTCGTYHDSRALTDEEIDIIQRWADSGAPEGEPRTDLAAPETPTLDSALEVATPEFTPEIQGGEFAEADEYRCFLIDPALAGDRFITGFEVIPGNAALVHHVLAMTVDPDLDVGGRKNRDIIQALDDQSPERLGWPCFGMAGEGVAVTATPVTWAPGQGALRFPGGAGVRVRQHDLVIIQVHYNLADPRTRGQSDKSLVRLELADSVATEGFFILPDPFLDTLVTGHPVSLAPGKESVTYSWEFPLMTLLGPFGLDHIKVRAVFPHMHEAGHKMRMDIVRGGTETCAADVQNWNFHWQLYYFYEQPLVLTPEDTIRVTCDYDTRGRSEPVLPGWGTRNEMCLMGMMLSL